MSNLSHSAMIEAVGLCKYFGSFAAIQDVSFQVRQGEVVAFLGPNGAGKSTTMKVLTGYLSPSAGTARIAGHDMATDRLAGSAKLGYLPENGPLYPDMTPRSLLEFFADARGMSPAASASGSPKSSNSAPWGASSASRSASCLAATASGWEWPTSCCTSPTC